MTTQHKPYPKELSPSAADMARHAHSNLALLFNLEKQKPHKCVHNNPEDCFEVCRCEQCPENKNNG